MTVCKLRILVRDKGVEPFCISFRGSTGYLTSSIIILYTNFDICTLIIDHLYIICSNGQLKNNNAIIKVKRGEIFPPFF